MPLMADGGIYTGQVEVDLQKARQRKPKKEERWHAVRKRLGLSQCTA